MAGKRRFSMAGKHRFSTAGKHGQRAVRKRELCKRELHMPEK